VFALEDDALGTRPTTSIEGNDVADGIRWVGLDVHAHEATIAIFDQDTGELITQQVAGRPHELIERLMDIPVPARMVYEAGPTGYGLARRGRAVGIEMAVCAPGRTDRSPTDRIKTDKRDAIRLARRLAAGELTLVTIPSVEHERLRDVVRSREDIRGDLMRARATGWGNSCCTPRSATKGRLGRGPASTERG
jgi:transposase